MEVAFRSECPNSNCTVGKSAPFSSKCVAKLWRSKGANVFGNTRGLRRFPASLPEHFRSDRLIRPPTVFRSRKQIGFRVHPAPVLAQSLQQLRTERHVAVTVPFPVPNVDQDAYAVNVGNLEMTKLGSTHAGRVKCHQHGTMEEIAG